ncbi:MAG: hypothetical protein AMXMBFR33_31740 [Candidatus Xenobia bacterium]
MRVLLLVVTLWVAVLAEPPLGVLCFRGNATRTYYGSGPVPQKPRVRWKAPVGGSGVWAGTGWTGQAAVVQWPGRSAPEVIVGGLDGRVRFFNGFTGKVTRPAFKLPAGGSIKSSVTVAQDLLFLGNRGGNYWALSFDGDVLGRIQGDCDPRSGSPVGYWPDFDSSGLVLGNELFVGGENGWFYKIPLRFGQNPVLGKRSEWRTVYTPTVTSLASESLQRSNGYCAIESSPAVTDKRVYLATGAGMLLGLNRQTLRPEFQFSTGDDTDASVVVNRSGYLFVASECDYGGGNRSRLYKLDPNVGLKNWKKAILWKRTFEAYPQKGGPGYEDNLDAGILGTPALDPTETRLYVGICTRPGKEGWLLCLDSRTGTTIWSSRYRAHVWSSPVVVDGKVLLADASGNLHCHRASDGKELWRVQLGGAIESTPVVWKGWVYVGARDGYFYALSDK